MAPAVLRPDEMKSACEKAGFFRNADGSERGKSWLIEKNPWQTGWYRMANRMVQANGSKLLDSQI